ncbi:MAG: hypothetical protein N2645_07900 [Clostridia bacterium]|nr:hypothetical protein [Clostridia bacterium]
MEYVNMISDNSTNGGSLDMKIKQSIFVLIIGGSLILAGCGNNLQNQQDNNLKSKITQEPNNKIDDKKDKTKSEKITIEKAESIVQEDASKKYTNVTASFSNEDENGDYVIAVRNNDTTTAKEFYYVNPYTGEFTSDTLKPITQNNNSNLESDVVGLWHATPHMAAGYGDRYNFYEDKTFKFDISQADGENRKIGYTGTWSISDNQLHIIIKKEKTLQGGHLESSPSTITGNQIVGGQVIASEVKPFKTLTFTFDSEDDGSGTLFKTIKNGKTKFYKMGSAPNQE